VHSRVGDSVRFDLRCSLGTPGRPGGAWGQGGAQISFFGEMWKQIGSDARYANMQGDQNREFRRASAECLELARHASDDNARAALLAMAQKWLELASDEFGARRFHDLLQELNEQQMLDTTPKH
jgi:hypothetical protein